MSEPVWKKSKSDTKWPKKAFNGIVTAIYPSINDNGTSLLKVDFDDGAKQINIYGLRVDKGEVSRTSGLDAFETSLEELKFESFWALDDDGKTALGYRTDPDIIGLRAWMQPLPPKEVGDDQQTDTSIWWGTVAKIERIAPESITAPAPKPVPKAQAPAAPKKKPEPQPQADLNEIVKAKLTEPTTLSELYTKLDKAYKPPVLRDVLVALKAEGWIEQLPGDKYKVIA